MNPQGSDSRTELLGSVSHTLSVTFVDGYNTMLQTTIQQEQKQFIQ